MSRGASDAAAAVVTCRHEVGHLLASAALGGSASAASDRIASAVHLVQTACNTLDTSMRIDANRVHEAPLMEAVRHAWCVHAPEISAETIKSQRTFIEGDLLSSAKAHLPLHSPLRLSEHTAPHNSGDARRCLELRVDGAFAAVVELVAAGSDGATAGIGGWLPCRVAVGPSHEPMPFAASQPPSLLIFADLTARAGALLAGLDAVAPAERLPHLVRWLAALDGLFDCVCAGCGEVFPPDATGAAQLLPPSARGPNLEPYHPGCFCARFGRSAEAAFLDGALHSMLTIR